MNESNIDIAHVGIDFTDQSLCLQKWQISKINCYVTDKSHSRIAPAVVHVCLFVCSWRIAIWMVSSGEAILLSTKPITKLSANWTNITMISLKPEEIKSFALYGIDWTWREAYDTYIQ